MTPDDAAVVAPNPAFYPAFCRRDGDAIDRLWSRAQPVACIHPGWDALIDRAAVMRSWRQIVESPSAPNIVCENETPFVLGDIAFVVCHEVLTEGVLAATNIFAREDGAWKLVHHQASPLALLPRDEPASPPTRLN